jgi:hypothetical protein
MSNKSHNDISSQYGSRKHGSFLQSKSSTKLSTPGQTQIAKKSIGKPLHSSKNQENNPNLMLIKPEWKHKDNPPALLGNWTLNLPQEGTQLGEHLQLNYLNDQRLSFLADSMQIGIDLNSSLKIRDFGATAEKETSKNVWQRRATIDNEYCLLNKLESTSKLEKKVVSKLLEGSPSYYDHSIGLMKTRRLSNLKDYLSPSSNIDIDSIQESEHATYEEKIIINDSPEEFMGKRSANQESEGSDIVKHVESSNSQSGKKYSCGLNLKVNIPNIQGFDSENSAKKLFSQMKVFKGISSKPKADMNQGKQQGTDGKTLFAVGGSTEREQMTIEAFDSQINQWKEVFRSSLPLECRSKFGAVLLNNKEILIFGGKTSSRRFKNSIAVDTIKGTLREHSFKLSEAKSGFGYCILNSKI